MYLTFEALREANNRRGKEWDPGEKLTPEFFMIGLIGEVGEAANIMKKIMRMEYGVRGSRATLADLGEELADIQIYLDRLAEACGIDLAAETVKKFNKTSEKYDLSVRLVHTGG